MLFYFIRIKGVHWNFYTNIFFYFFFIRCHHGNGKKKKNNNNYGNYCFTTQILDFGMGFKCLATLTLKHTFEFVNFFDRDLFYFFFLHGF